MAETVCICVSNNNLRISYPIFIKRDRKATPLEVIPFQTEIFILATCTLHVEETLAPFGEDSTLHNN
jgi:hypothetical protein